MNLGIWSLLLSSLALVGCGYTLEGHVLKGGMPSVNWVNGNDRLPDGQPVAGATVLLVRDPTGMHPETVGTATSNGDGTFKLNVSSFGAGWMQEQWMIRGARGGVGSAEWVGELPSSTTGQRLVIIVAPDGDLPIDSAWRGNVGHRENSASLMDEMRRYR